MTEVAIPPSELVKVSELKVDGNNPNKMTPQQHKALSESMTRYGFIVPIITNKDLLIADGEQRLTVAQSLHMTHVPVIRLPVEDVDRRLLRQVLNKLRGEHDLLLDAHEFDKIIEAGHERDLKQLLLLSDSQIERYLTEIREPKEESYEIPEIEKIQTDIKRGDVYLLGRHRLMCGDAENIMDTCLLVEGDDLKKLDVLLTDPPYGINVVSRRSTQIGGAKEVTFAKTVGGDNTVEAHSYIPIEGDNKPFNPSHLLNKAKSLIIFGANYFADKLPMSAGWLVWDKEGGREWEDTFADCELIWTNRTKHASIYRCLWKGMVKQGESGTRIHPTQKPLKLLRDIIHDFSEPNQTILDLYGGSGSTLIACEQTNRTCYMMEIEPRYCQIIINRWEAYTNQKAVKVNA